MSNNHFLENSKNNKKTTKQLVKEIKENQQDFEWYPTTKEILEAMYWDIKSHKTNYWYGKENASDENSLCKYEYQSLSLLDIGAGNCKLFDVFNSISEDNKKIYGEYKRVLNGNMLNINKYMVIEKSQTLIDNMPNEVFVVGTDFHENFLVDKRADIVFCNPPYSEYEQWTQRIIKEANADYIYLVIPKRWGKVIGIKGAIRDRNAKVKIIGDFSFENSEDRKARAKVSLIKVSLKTKKKFTNPRGESTSYDIDPTDPFDTWIEETFDFTKAKEDSKLADYEVKRKEQEDLKNQLVDATDLVGTLVELYNKEMDTLVSNYKKVAELDSAILEELNVSIGKLKSGIKEKIIGLKHKYWKEIFDNLGDIKKRLTAKSRQSLVDSLNKNTNIDFTRSNIRAVVIWTIKNANKYYEEQMIEVYDDLVSKESVKLYKSNKHFDHDSWRYLQGLNEAGAKYALDYRIVRAGYLDDYDKKYKEGISQPQINAIEDILVIAMNLGFSMNNRNINPRDLKRGNENKTNLYMNISKDRILRKGTKTQLGKIDEVYIHTNVPNSNGDRLEIKDGIIYVYDKDNNGDEIQYKIDGKYHHWSDPLIPTDTFTTVKGYQNGNVHFQFNKEFIKKLNLEVGRLRGWIKNPNEAAEEFDISIEKAHEYWNSTFQALPSTIGNLLPKPQQKEPNYLIKDIENNEIGLFEDENLIYKSDNGSIIALSDTLLDDIPNEIESAFMNEVSNKKVADSTIKENDTLTIDVDVVDVKNEKENNDGIYPDEVLKSIESGSLF